MKCVFPFHLLLSIIQTQMHFQFQQLGREKPMFLKLSKIKTKNLGKASSGAHTAHILVTQDVYLGVVWGIFLILKK